MSRIGNKEIPLPDKVKVSVGAQGDVVVEGPKGKLSWTLPREIQMAIEDGKVRFSPADSSKRTKALHGLSRSLVNNMVTGVSAGFRRNLEIQGVGFKAAVQGKFLNLALGKSHPINHPIPDALKVVVADNTKISVEGTDRQLVGQFAADVRGYYPPEPYKGKGVRYSDEVVRRKEGKTVQ